MPIQPWPYGFRPPKSMWPPGAGVFHRMRSDFDSDHRIPAEAIKGRGDVLRVSVS
jgi:hypothetical protein